MEVIEGKIGIATVLFNSSEVLPDFFHSLEEQANANYIVFAIDNASQDDSVRMCEGRDRFVITQNDSNLGFAPATNQAIRQALKAGCEYVMLLNNDVVFYAGFFAELLAGLKRNHAAMTAPLTYFHDQPTTIWAAGGMLQRWAGYRPLHLGENEFDNGQFAEDRKIQFAPGSCILIHRDVFHKIGLLDETYFTYWEDTDFAVRALKARIPFFLISEAKLWHKVSSLAGKGSAFQRFYAVRNHALYVKKHTSWFESFALSALYLSAYRLAALLGLGDKERIDHWKQGLALAEEVNGRT